MVNRQSVLISYMECNIDLLQMHVQVLGHMQRTDVSRPREQLHAPTLQEMLEMDSEIDGGESA